MKNTRVIYLEDDLAIFGTLETSLQKFEFQLIHMQRNEESLSKIETLNPDIILIEHRNSDRRHYDLLFMMDELETFSRIPKIVISARNQNYELLWTTQNRLWDYITYPFQTEELVERIDYWLAQK